LEGAAGVAHSSLAYGNEYHGGRATPWKVVDQNLALPWKVADPNPASPWKVADSNRALPR
jgi:hypothetical protein